MPPKKDAFADLFSSATGSNNTSSKLKNLSLSERQKIQKPPRNQSHPYSNQSDSSSLNSSWSNLDILSPEPSLNHSRQPSRTSSPLVDQQFRKSRDSKSPTPDIDPFSIFDSEFKHTDEKKLKPVNDKSNEISLLDDEFTNVYTEVSSNQESKPLPSTKINAKNVQVDKTNNDLTEKKDFILAELVDMGFSITDANKAIEDSGLNLQSCVNQIMSKNTKKQSKSKANDDSILGVRPESINFNELGNNIYKQANNIFNIGRKHVMKNIEQLKESRSSSQNGNNGMPEWMRNQSKYKSQASEKKYGGEDYGSDEDNINHEEIEKFMRLQKEKDAEKSRQRFNFRNESKQKTPPPHSVKPQRAEEIKIQPRPNKYRSKIDSDDPNLPTSTNTNASSDLSSSKPVILPQEEDILGMFSPDGTSNKSASSSIRDSSPLNQIIDSDYTTQKNQAQIAYKSGDYTTALELFTKCLSLLPLNHELRIVILSNLASINKLSGHLKQSLENVQEAVKLIEDHEIASEYEISQKPIKYWYTKLISIKAETLELLEKYEESLKNYIILIQQLNCNDKKIMDGKRRVDKIVNPQNYKSVKFISKESISKDKVVKSVSVKPQVEEVDSMVQDKINLKIQAWADSKQNNLRTMLTNLQEIIPPTIKMNDKLKSLTLHDLMLPKQVKINYMKIISSIHPDKLVSQTKTDQESFVLCNGIFIILNKRWETFKQEENV